MSTIIGGKIVVVLTGVKDCGGRGGMIRKRLHERLFVSSPPKKKNKTKQKTKMAGQSVVSLYSHFIVKIISHFVHSSDTIVL